eukprot:TRINITY_DN8723_c0_g2_i1.p1 TRINITY_DN8723_c0_g2~~TRINITY_DN8723_c0_g2_i1.p1  ORF type:complete len:107 (-),score=17.23 TRINITY_DN8723_c0_g2_i1:211-531(-)
MSKRVKDLLLGTPCLRQHEIHPTDLKEFPLESKEHYVELSVIMKEHYHVYKMETFKVGSATLYHLRNDFNSHHNVFWSSKQVNSEKQEATECYLGHKTPRPFSPTQ